MYILILIFFFGDGQGRGGVSQQGYEFTSVKQCENAKKLYYDPDFLGMNAVNGVLHVSAECVKK